MVEMLTPYRPIAPQSTPFGETPTFAQNPEISPNFSTREALKIAAGTGLVLVGCAMLLDGSISHSNFETIGGAILVIGGIYVLTRK